MNKLFIDANYIIAIFREIELKHELAVKSCKELLKNYDCIISNGIITEVTTIIMMRTKDLELTQKAYYFMKDNFNIIDEYSIENYNDKVFALFQKYNKDSFKVGFIDCSIPVISNYFDIDSVVTFDKHFKVFDEIDLFDVESLI